VPTGDEPDHNRWDAYDDREDDQVPQFTGECHRASMTPDYSVLVGRWVASKGAGMKARAAIFGRYPSKEVGRECEVPMGDGGVAFAILAGCVAASGCASSPVPREARAWSASPWFEEDAKGEGGAAAPEAAGADDLSKATQNPLADLISLPLQSNFDFGVGHDDDLRYILNIQPVLPQSLNDRWNWIHRAIVPVIDQPEPFPGAGEETGLGDVVYQGFLSPARPGKVIWGAGCVGLFPTAGDDLLGAEKWGAGPAAVALTSDGPWLYGVLANHIRSFAGDDDREDVSLTTIQPFVNYNLPGAWAISYSPIITCNWEADRGRDSWTVPVGLGVSKVTRLGRHPVKFALSAFHYAAHPEIGPDWSIQFTITLLFPK
jgi:hypothetical protein